VSRPPRDGRDGRDGKDGLDGKDGIGKEGPRGLKGDKGDKGDKGEPGKDLIKPPVPWHADFVRDESGRTSYVDIKSADPQRAQWRITPEWQASEMTGAAIIPL
jgi:hypothetical protein